MAKQPAFQFYPGDWQKDPALRRSKHQAKGVWMDMLCLMFDCDERGVLADPGGEPWTKEEIAYAVGGPLESTLEAIDALIVAGVAKVRSDGAIYCKRMVYDEANRQKKVEAGRLGGKQKASNLVGKLRSGSVTATLPSDLAKMRSSSSSSTSVSTGDPPREKCEGSRRAVRGESVLGALQYPQELSSERFRDAFPKWVRHRMGKSKPGVPWQEFFQEQLTDLAAMGEEKAFATVEHSRKQGWQGLFPPRSQGSQSRDLPQSTPTGTVEDVL